MTSGLEAAETFAYVDNCLTPAERRAFESRLRDDPELRREVLHWESQNSAIRAAYGAPASTPGAIDLGRNSNENQPTRIAAPPRDWRPSAPGRIGEPKTEPKPLLTTPHARATTPPPRTVRQAKTAARKRFARALMAVFALTAALLFVGPLGDPSWPRDKMIAAGLAAYRAFATPTALTPLEFRTADPEALTKWLTPQFSRGIVAPEVRSSTFKLIGGRIAPGTIASAAFVVYENALGKRVGLLIEPLDAPSPTEPKTRRREGLSVAAWTDAGHGLVAIGADRASVVEFTDLIDPPARR